MKYSLKRQHREVEQFETLFFIATALHRDWESAVEEKQQLIKNCRNSRAGLAVALSLHWLYLSHFETCC